MYYQQMATVFCQADVKEVKVPGVLKTFGILRLIVIFLSLNVLRAIGSWARLCVVVVLLCTLFCLLRNSQASLEAQRDTRSVGCVCAARFGRIVAWDSSSCGCLRNNGANVVRRVTPRAQVSLSRGAAGNGLCVRLSTDVLLFVSAAAERVNRLSCMRACVWVAELRDIFVVARVLLYLFLDFFHLALRIFHITQRDSDIFPCHANSRLLLARRCFGSRDDKRGRR